MKSLAQATDYDLFRSGLIPIAKNASSVLHPLQCDLGRDHDWSKTLDDIDGEAPYQFCRSCGGVRKSPWRKDT